MVILRGFTGNSPPEGTDLIHVSAEAMQINGKTREIADLADIFGKPHMKDANILIISEGNTPISTVGKIIKAMSDIGLTKISLSMSIEMAEQGDGLQEAPEE